MWPFENQFFPGIVNSIYCNGSRVAHYNGDDIETLELMRENWKYISSHTMNSATSSFDMTLASRKITVLSKAFDIIENRLLLRRNAQAFELSLIVNAYNLEKKSFLEIAKVV